MFCSKYPKISVLMPVYNCELYIRDSIESILNQTFGNFELLIIDDASTDKTVNIIKRYNDSRIKLIEKPENTGYTNSLNFGLSIAKGEYIARMDGDDISFPERFAKQVAFLDINQEVVLCGTAIKVIGTDKVICYPEFHEFIKIELLKYNCIIHPSVMIRRSVLDYYFIKYDISKEPAEDYNLWTELLLYGKFYNFQEVLLYYRVHESQVTQKRNNDQIESSINAQIQLLDNLNIAFDKLLMSSLLRKFLEGKKYFYKEILFFNDVKKKLLLANSSKFFEPTGFKDYLDEMEIKIIKSYFFKRQSYNPIIIFQYIMFKRRQSYEFTFKYELKLLIKSLLFWNVEKV